MEWRLKVGDSVDGWKLVERLGKGGNGEVWVAEHPEFGKGALKLLKLQYQGEDQKRYLRFRHEALKHQELARRHAGVLPFLGCSLPDNPTRDAPAWLATPVATPIRGSLSGRPLREAVMALASVAGKLAALHAEGVSHRDVKPENLFCHQGRWVLGDFGLVDYPDKESLTDTGERLGPFHYLAPEMQDEANRADGRKADVFSLGKTLWVLATEQHTPPPGELRADNPQLAIRAYRADARARQLDLLVERATRLSPEDRPPMAEFAEELAAWLSTPEIGPQPDLMDVLARIRDLSPPALRSGDDRARLRQGTEMLRAEVQAGMRALAQKLAATGLSDGSVGSTVPGDLLFERRLAAGYIWGTNLVCGAALPVGRHAVNLSCTVVVRVYPDNTTKFCGGYRVGLGGPGDSLVGVNVWGGVFGSPTQDRAVAELFNSLNENLGEALQTFAEVAEKVRTRGP